MTQCQHCAAKAQLFLCNRCTDTLRTTLADMPWWLDRLTESAIGHTRLGDGGRRSEPDGLVRYTDTTEGDERLERDIGAGRLSLDRALAAGGVNAKASRLLEEIGNMLTTWVRDTCETRGLDTPTLRTATGAARWLTERVSALAAGEGAGECLSDVLRATERVEKTINRPIPMRWLGPCPTWVESTAKACGNELWCRADAAEAYCRACRQTHNPDRLQLLLMNDLERKKLTWAKLIEVNRRQPEQYQIPERTLTWWRQKGKLTIRGYRRPDGREVINRHNEADEPLYKWADIRKLRAEQGKAKAG
jgi:hypothetical protein